MITGIAYFALVMVMQGSFLWSSGMGYENVWPWLSESRGAIGGFVYPADPMRPYLTVFYHVSYLVGKLLGGGFAGFQLVYAALWWARGFLVFAILRRVLGGHTFLCYLAGAMTIVHAADSALGWVGQIHQPGFIVWMLLGVYLLLLTIQDTGKVRVWLWVPLAGICAYLSLWTYESGLFLIFLAPPLLFFACRAKRLASFAAASVVWYSVIAEYLREAAVRYLHNAHSYQQSLLRKDLGIATLAGDLWFNVTHTLSFWSWFWIPNIDVSHAAVRWVALICVTVFVAGGVMVARSGGLQDRLPVRSLVVLLPVGLVLIAASFPAYLLLDSARGHFRTMFLSGAPAALFLTALTGLIVYGLPAGLRVVLSLALVSVMVFFSCCRAIQCDSYYRVKWEAHRQAIAQVVRAAPQVKPFTVFVLTNVPRAHDPFENDMWLDVALRLAYPGTPVCGVFLFDDGSAGPGNGYQLESNQWRANDTAWSPIVTEAPLQNTLAIEFSGNGAAVLQRMPEAVCKGCDQGLYNPESRIIRRAPDSRTVARYGPL
jgi:hypothetical protein